MNEISRSQVETLLNGDQKYSGSPFYNLRTLGSNTDIYKAVQYTVEESLLECAHSFRLSCIEIVPTIVERSRKFRSELYRLPTPRPHLLFHGTEESNHQSIFDTGFSLDDDHWGDTDAGYIGKGIYLSPLPEYSASYIKETDGITRFNYYEPVKVGVTCKLLGCLALVGQTKQLYERTSESEIQSHLQSHWAWVNKDGDITKVESDFFAQEYAIKETVHVYPRFRVSLVRVTKEVVWVDPNINNDENSRYVAELKQMDGISLFATSRRDKALAALKKGKVATDYRAVTAGRGGEEFVRSLRAAGIHCKVMVFCGAVAYHKEWAKKFSNVEVTNSVSIFKKYATWKY